MAEFGRLDTLFNNASVMLLGPAEDAPIEGWDRRVDLNVKGLLYAAHAALPHLLAAAEDGPRRVADLVNTSSVAGRRPRAGSAVYNLTKPAWATSGSPCARRSPAATCASRWSSRARWPPSSQATCARRSASGRSSGSPASRGSGPRT